MIGSPRVETFLGADGQGYWRLVSGNGETVAQSEGYQDGLRGAERGAQAMVRTVLRLLEAHEIEPVAVDPEGRG